MKTEPTQCTQVLQVHPVAMVVPQTPQGKETSRSAERRKELSLKRKALFAKIPKGFSEILTGKLWLGSCRDARQKHKLLDMGITHIINCAIEWKNHFPSSFIYYNGNVFDNENQDLSVFFSEAFDFLDNVFKVPTNKVFIHCVVGKSRSAALTMGYLMRVEHLTLKQAFAHVKACRPIVNPNDGFMRQLMALEMQIFNTSSSSMTWGEWKQSKPTPAFDTPPPTLPTPPLHQDAPSPLPVTLPLPLPLPPLPPLSTSTSNPFALPDTEIEQENFLAESTSPRPHTPTPTSITPITPITPLSPEILHETSQDIQATLNSFVQVRITPQLLRHGLQKVCGVAYEEDPANILQWAHPPASCSEGIPRGLAISKDDITT
eukprot:Phypoly_transcript_08597.p1 GENE.Phypoly_transcript_08597~~Phypoly_transcript_08597.p1  ORF type:complete len:406 (-),score=78.88 Phypoly_transcript_08597:280-1404(-)